MSNGSDPSNNTSNRLPSAGDGIRRISSTGKFNQPTSDRTNATATAPSGIQRQSSNVSLNPHEIQTKTIYFFKQGSGNNSSNHSANSMEDMSLAFMKVSSMKSTSTPNEQQQPNGTKKKVIR